VKSYVPTVYKRKYAEHDDVSFVDLRLAYETAAGMVAEYGDKYLPWFERLEKEMQARQAQDATKNRALEVAKRAKENQPSIQK